MKKTEKIVAAGLTIALGILLMLLKADIISIIMTVLGGGWIALGLVDLVHKLVPPAIVKIVAGAVVILCGWIIVSAVLYIVAAMLLIAGIILLYEKIKNTPSVVECDRVTGEYSLLIKVVFKNTLEMDKFINTLQVYGRTKTQIVFSTIISHRGVII